MASHDEQKNTEELEQVFNKVISACLRRVLVVVLLMIVLIVLVSIFVQLIVG